MYLVTANTDRKSFYVTLAEDFIFNTGYKTELKNIYFLIRK